MRPHSRALFHARVLIVGAGGLVVLWTGIALTRGGVFAGGYGAIGPAAAAAATAVLLVTSWLGWIDLVSALSLSIDEKALSLGWPTRRVVPWSDVTSVQRSLGTLRLVLKTKGATERIQLLVDKTPPKTLAKLVRSVSGAGGKVEEYLLKLADYVEDTAEPD